MNKINKKSKKQSTNKAIQRNEYPTNLAVLPTRDVIPFPGVMLALYVSKTSALKALEESSSTSRYIFLAGQKNLDAEYPRTQDLYKVGVIAHIVKTLTMPDGQVKVLLQGNTRAKALEFKRDDIIRAEVEPIFYDLSNLESSSQKISKETKKIVDKIKVNLQLLVEKEYFPEEILLATEEVADPGILADTILAHSRIIPAKAQEALEELDPVKRIKIAEEIINDDLNQFLISQDIQDRARDELNKGQREYYLREQIKQIQRELGEGDTFSEDLAQLRLAFEKAKLPKHAYKEGIKQITRLERMSPEASEYALLRTYLDWIVELPWGQRTKDRLDLKLAKKVLDQDHYGLDKIKDRILEYLSVRKLNENLKGPILCFVGPPGVGKTSLGQSIARALNRKYFRFSLGGVRDEAEIRGHRRTYVGALPGRVIQGLKQVNSKNCVILLDELDKLGADFRGDPASALLEVLDPQQNKDFRDHYLNIPFDLSEVLFIATANTADTIPDALLDRLEIIYLSGYTTQEKENISKRFIIPRQLEENGLKGTSITFDDSAINYIIERYTLEAGVRNLEREFSSLARKIARAYTETNKLTRKITKEVVTKLLGTTKFDPEMHDTKDTVGVARGLAWTVNGGEIMPIETSYAKGSGALNLTGQLGSVMQESAQAAVFYARANAQKLGLKADFYQKNDIHVHVPNGATPKDGPSAGITICATIISALTGIPIRGDLAMTGEITLRGNVLPVGGIKEKSLAALRYGIKQIIIPEDNLKDLEEIPKEQREQIKFIPVKEIGEVLDLVLIKKDKKKPNPDKTKTKKKR